MGTLLTKKDIVGSSGYREITAGSGITITEDDGTITITATGGGGYTEGARAYHDANQSIANGVDTVVAFNSERYDTDAIHDTATNNSRLTCKTAGKYIIAASIAFAANTTSVRIVGIKLNGATLLANFVVNAVAAGGTYCNVATIYDLAVNDYVQTMAYQLSGGALNVTSNPNYSPEFMMQRVG